MYKRLHVRDVNYRADGNVTEDAVSKVRVPRRFNLLAEFPGGATALRFSCYGYSFGGLLIVR
jgi:hypothetical protein